MSNNIEKQLLGEKIEDAKKTIDQELEDAKKEREREPDIIKNFNKVPKHKIWSNNVVYEVINKKLKNSSFLNGEQAYSLKDSNNYVVRFVHYER